MPPLAPQKALRRQGQALASGAPCSDVSTSKVAGNVPPASTAVVRREKPATPASPPPNPTLSVGAALSEAKVEKSVEMGMAALEKLPWFGLDPTPKVTLPKESAAPLPLATEASGSTAKAGADAGA
jgi:hypothetical protein